LKTGHLGLGLLVLQLESILRVSVFNGFNQSASLRDSLKISFAHYSSCRLESSKPHPYMFYCSRLFFLPLTELCVVVLYQQPTWNNALLKMFRCNFEGTDPYITCIPFLHHHRLSPQDQFLVLSSDGLYQYLSNEEVVCHVEWFMQNFPDGDPAQHLIEELLFRAAKKNGRTSALFTILST
jgi:hypothetical protein